MTLFLYKMTSTVLQVKPTSTKIDNYYIQNMRPKVKYSRTPSPLKEDI